jgi:hypothetical protein
MRTKERKNEQSNRRRRRRRKKIDDKEKHYISFAATILINKMSSVVYLNESIVFKSSFYTCKYFPHYIQIYVNKRTTLNNSK